MSTLVDQVADAMWRAVNDRGAVRQERPQRKIGRYEWSLYRCMAEAAVEVMGDVGSTISCVVDDCPQRFVDYDSLNRHSRLAHMQVTSRYPGVTDAGDFRWFTE